MTDIVANDIPDNWQDDPLENTGPVRTGNFLRSRGYENPDEMRVKFLLVAKLRETIQAKSLRQVDVVRLAQDALGHSGISQPDVSRILNGNVKNVSLWRLIELLNVVGNNVHIFTAVANDEHATTDVLEKEDVLALCEA